MQRKPKGRLELTWMGKDSALIPLEDGKYDYAWVDPNDPRAREVKSIEVLQTVGEVDGPTGANENLLIIGDSGDALRSLRTIPEYADKYLGRVKLVYIDPPFNTSQTFEHYADQLEHSIWLSMMRDRIRDIKPLLADDASVWVHLDDAEVHRMRVLLDEEFGPENFVATVVWQKADSTRNDAKGVSGDHDTIVAYRVGPGWKPNRLARTATSDARFSSPDGDPLPWFDDNPSAPGARTHQGMVYAIQHPITGKLHYPARGRCWWTDQRYLLSFMNEYAPYELRDVHDAAMRAGLCGVPTDEVRAGVKAIMLATSDEEARISAWARLAQGTWPMVILRSEGTGGLGRKSYVPSGGLVPSTWWTNSEVGHNREAKAELKSLFPGAIPFATPKPERLLERIVHIASCPGDLVLDCFAGSGTTAAVAQKMRRHWITVELQQSTAKTFIIPRLTKVVDGTDMGGITSKVERVAADELPDGVTPKDAQEFNRVLRKVVESLGGLDVTTVKALRAATRTRDETTKLWQGGGGFTVAQMGPSMYEVDDPDGAVYLSSRATNGAWSKAIAGQLRFTLTPNDPVFCGVRNRQRLAVIDGVADETVVRTVVEHLGDKEKAVIVAKGVVPEAGQLLEELSPGSRIKKAPADIFPKATVK
jgi:adenine-specific DNA-methyltransferase